MPRTAARPQIRTETISRPGRPVDAPATPHHQSRASAPLRRIPTDAELTAIPLATAGEFDLSDLETVKTRRRMYALNKDNTSFRFRSMREGTLLLVWRIRR